MVLISCALRLRHFHPLLVGKKPVCCSGHRWIGLVMALLLLVVVVVELLLLVVVVVELLLLVVVGPLPLLVAEIIPYPYLNLMKTVILFNNEHSLCHGWT